MVALPLLGATPPERHLDRAADTLIGPVHPALRIDCGTAPYMWAARRAMAVPAYTFPATACSVQPSGARAETRPASTSSWAVTPFPPSK